MGRTGHHQHNRPHGQRGQGFDLTGLGVIRNSDLDVTTGIPDSSYTSFSGQAVTPDDVLVKYTYIGDANLSGAVSFDDYVGMDNAFFGLIPNLGWATGDINFDDVINFDDYSKVDQAFFFQGALEWRSRMGASSAETADDHPSNRRSQRTTDGCVDESAKRLRIIYV